MTSLIFTPSSGPGARISPDPTTATGSPAKHIPADPTQAGLAPGVRLSPDPTTAAGQVITVT